MGKPVQEGSVGGGHPRTETSQVSRAHRIWYAYLGFAGLGALALAAAQGIALSRLSLEGWSVDEFAAVCAEWALSEVTAASLAILGVGSLGLAVIVVTLRSLTRQVRDTWRLRRSLHVVGRVRTPGGTARVIDGRVPQAFCMGLASPQAYVSTAAVEKLDGDELFAVVAHEAEHARRRDPLRVMVARALGRGFFFLPILGRLAERYAALAECEADAAAVRRTGDRGCLASALLIFDSGMAGSVGIAPERVDELVGRRNRWSFPILLAAGCVAIAATVLAVAARSAAATGAASIRVSMLAVDICMVAMVAVPMLAGCGLVLGARRWLRGHRASGRRVRRTRGRRVRSRHVASRGSG
jgi:Zn-dependent protease with chaperone function